VDKNRVRLAMGVALAGVRLDTTGWNALITECETPCDPENSEGRRSADR
jgi:hypothetical protein